MTDELGSKYQKTRRRQYHGRCHFLLGSGLQSKVVERAREYEREKVSLAAGCHGLFPPRDDRKAMVIACQMSKQTQMMCVDSVVGLMKV